MSSLRQPSHRQRIVAEFRACRLAARCTLCQGGNVVQPRSEVLVLQAMRPRRAVVRRMLLYLLSVLICPFLMRKSSPMMPIPTKRGVMFLLFTFFLVVYLFLYAGTFTWRVSTAILLITTPGCRQEIRMTDERRRVSFHGCCCPTGRCAAPPVPGDYFSLCRGLLQVLRWVCRPPDRLNGCWFASMCPIP